MESVRKFAGWALASTLAGVCVLGIAGERLELSPRTYNAFKATLVIAFGFALLTYVIAASPMEGRTRPDRVTRGASKLGLRYESEDASRLPYPGLVRLLPGTPRHVMTGTHRQRLLVACLAERHGGEETTYTGCVTVELPSPLEDFGVATHKLKVHPCADWPPNPSMSSGRRPREVPSAYTAVVDDPFMRGWLEACGDYHFHVHDRWLICVGPKVDPEAEDGGGAMMQPIMDAATGFADRVPQHIFWRAGVKTTSVDANSPTSAADSERPYTLFHEVGGGSASLGSFATLNQAVEHAKSLRLGRRSHVYVTIGDYVDGRVVWDPKIRRESRALWDDDES